jgi:hypothetical protein
MARPVQQIEKRNLAETFSSRATSRDKVSGRRGAVLLLTVFAIAFVAVLITAFLQVSTTDLQIVRNHQYSTRALYVAEAGIEDAIYELRQDNTWDSGFTDKAFGGDAYTVAVSNNYPIVVIDSTSTVDGGFQRQIQVQVTISGPPSPTPYPVAVNYWKEI